MAYEILQQIAELLLPSARMVTGVTTIGTAFTAITAVSTSRKRLTIQNTGSSTITLAGTSATVTFTGGFYLQPQSEIQLPVTAAVLIYGLSSVITQVRVLELD